MGVGVTRAEEPTTVHVTQPNTPRTTRTQTSTTTTVMKSMVTETSGSAEAWKGMSPAYPVNVGAMTGLGLVDGQAGVGLIFAGAVRVMERGFIPDINNQLFVEGELGALFLNGGTGFEYSLHLRWDFVHSERWTVFALGGFGGISGGSSLGNIFRFHPRFGAGAVYYFQDNLGIRAELSHELTLVGITFRF